MDVCMGWGLRERVVWSLRDRLAWDSMNFCTSQTSSLIVFLLEKSMKKELALPLFCLATAMKKKERSAQLGLSVARLIKILRENTSYQSTAP